MELGEERYNSRRALATRADTTRLKVESSNFLPQVQISSFPCNLTLVLAAQAGDGLLSSQPSRFELVPHCDQQILSMQDLCLYPPGQLCILSAGGAQGAGPGNRQNACWSGVVWKLFPGLPDQQRWLGTSSRACFGVQGVASKISRPTNASFWG
eukprot:1160210-Pelagomonas_calceolata.AAC.3